MKVLVSGGTGLVGRYIVEGLLDAGYDVRVGARKPPAGDFFSRTVSFVSLDLAARRDQTSAFDDMDAFVHAAFDHIPGKYRGGEGSDPKRFRRLNLDGTVRLFETAKRAGVKRAVFLSSRAVYDGLPPGTALTEDLKLSPTSLYGEMKLACESALAAMSGPDFVTSSLRATGVYGDFLPNKWDGLVADVSAGRPVVPRAGTEVHGVDVAQAVRLMLEAEPRDISGQSFNLSDITVDTRMILERLGMPADLLAFATLAANEMVTEKIRRIGWKPGGMRRFEKTMTSLARQLNAAN
ncbi:Nucleoside-diphosphate-sugar epimerase [Rhizobium sp. NFR07]|uniref:NAD-dependent epimerase/dehydratase family protein n=1 Tax=Rhizobium sp. NFR07 TaxID=1566262 RepID=UPI0008E1AEB0|nr:NAD(P)-dependent oxidoreductase [Rhizobium sp. NFR07]SFB53096.1 Nucleoside-diphosphate-sugar epimerase [Rhizobium sp. NFR07]